MRRLRRGLTRRCYLFAGECRYYSRGITLGLLTCLLRCSEVVDLLARTALIHVTDLETLACAVGMMEDIPGLTTSHLSRDVGTMLLGVTHLSITLKLPLAFFQSLERLPEEGEEASADSKPTPPLSLDVERWSRLAPSLNQLKNLTHLYLSLDHSSPESWSLVNERAVLSPIITHLCASTYPQSLNTTIVLPNLHPKFERKDRHFTTTPTLSLPSSQLQVQLLRRLRQRYHSNENDNARCYGRVVHRPDFPISLKFLLEYAEFWGDSVEQLVEWEREEWGRGESNLMRELHILTSGAFCCNYGNL